jgi:hypothetical protein
VYQGEQYGFAAKIGFGERDRRRRVQQRPDEVILGRDIPDR